MIPSLAPLTLFLANPKPVIYTIVTTRMHNVIMYVQNIQNHYILQALLNIVYCNTQLNSEYLLAPNIYIPNGKRTKNLKK